VKSFDEMTDNEIIKRDLDARKFALAAVRGGKPATYKLKKNCFNCGHSGFEVEIPWGVWASRCPTPCPKCGCVEQDMPGPVR
jgi:hypothetical protein